MEHLDVSSGNAGNNQIAGLRLQVEAGGAPVGRQQLSESVATHLREQIVWGRLQLGEFLRIDAIAHELDISTTPVREGLLLLQSESFVRDQRLINGRRLFPATCRSRPRPTYPAAPMARTTASARFRLTIDNALCIIGRTA